ncbi:5-(carboxyamino)imidazole ribonucleotide synthase [Rhodobacter sphaeroides]|jgi:5-(carboxyamino)imidazole ribonucleotide synthase|uniref:N5-carboxyaminoimidazole ribonucleotide synthase n=1 Tax=Cereibacter sphaeroides (strain ATCC 17023 / DSM 158 / JCM 6121 / CCUG 31486 / LMG 2827 / NBRC 12203 / NCIMB 8253 / ATH 2.4.1.) TaxID=272943 RepID=Q3J672_CERS4|nr:5-(carboxyamino)imidazole ribonucleotide synthase [Cereibacter sphaeroides]ABA77712.1 5-(carboxyamino)imidazole ribonucleotide synthase [Cereibacter sphaeroides 2.4.1]AMJ46112.1 phosphoribosylaminoimidazole carboxylase [Cereibacter sphaeroides]ANS32824.1 5-(carboxyamino)imidazole ribonucleotide synthase [Cereibacter sphaeroides]ATN61876.1 5-(carboxyamino)imidazole ribonucleotide synthase [Cereibacter sphaeroides]AXC59960.1 5-(carboxyamino)imidazole ribonucleotide synthase [Cereibacter sphae
MTDRLPPGSTIGILGGGQLGRMLSVAAARLGFRTHIFEPSANPPAADVAHAVTTAPYEDEAALRAFATSVDVITYEFENIPTSALDLLEALKPLHPNRRALAVSQDRLEEKGFLTGLGLAVAPYRPVGSREDLEAAIHGIGTPAILKTTRLGYDGKGQARLMEPDDAAEAFAAMGGQPAVLEGFVRFTHEVSVIAARGRDGSVAVYEPGENVHLSGILHTTTVPARLTASQRTDAVLLAGRILNALDYVGVMGVELFVTPEALLVNEIAPRVHNSGHWTQNGCAVDQFEQHIRAITGWPLGDGSRFADVEMENLIGHDVARVPALALEKHTAIHLYGKAEARPGRKMGHVNRILRPVTGA